MRTQPDGVRDESFKEEKNERKKTQHNVNLQTACEAPGDIMAKPQYIYEEVMTLELHHLPGTTLIINKMTGGPIPETASQFYVNTRFRKSDGKTTVRTKGFSIQADDIPAICSELLKILTACKS